MSNDPNRIEIDFDGPVYDEWASALRVTAVDEISDLISYEASRPQAKRMTNEEILESIKQILGELEVSLSDENYIGYLELEERPW